MIKRLSLLTLTLASVLSLAGCERDTRTVLETKVLEATIVEIDPPKHFHVEVQSELGRFSLSSSKHCSSYTNVSIGDKVLLPYTVYQYRDEKYSEFDISSCTLAKNIEKYKVVNHENSVSGVNN